MQCDHNSSYSGLFFLFGLEYSSRWMSHWMLTPCTEQTCFVHMYPLTVHCSFKLMVQEKTHSMRLRSSVIKTPLLGGDRDFMAEVITEASAEGAIQSSCGRFRVCVCVVGDG
jgi:hypothetical protein